MTGLVLPMVAAVSVGIALVIVAGANGGSGAMPPESAGFPPARDASADFTGPSAQARAIASSSTSEVAAGSAGREPAAWASSDGGATWTRATGMAGRAGNELTSVVHGAAGWLAVGGSGTQGRHGQSGPLSGGPPAGGPPLVEGSVGGTAWTEADGEGTFSGNGLVTAAAAAGPAGYVIVGRQSVSGQTTAAAWYSRSLTGWAQAGDAGTGDLQGDGNRQMNAVTAAARGFTAVGSSGNRPAVWRSASGRAWAETTLPLPSGAARAALGYVAASGASVTAAGTATSPAGQPVPFTAVSPNGGVSWKLEMLPLPRLASAASVTALTATGRGFTATGIYGQHVIVWAKAGRQASWTEAAPAVRGLSGPGTHEITALSSSGTTLTGVGFSATAATESPTLWQTPLRG
jgi:hypothetical protein